MVIMRVSSAAGGSQLRSIHYCNSERRCRIARRVERNSARQRPILTPPKVVCSCIERIAVCPGLTEHRNCQAGSGSSRGLQLVRSRGDAPAVVVGAGPGEGGGGGGGERGRGDVEARAELRVVEDVRGASLVDHLGELGGLGRNRPATRSRRGERRVKRGSTPTA